MEGDKKPTTSDDIDLVDFSKLRKKKAKEAVAASEPKEQSTKVNNEQRYLNLLATIRTNLQKNNPELASKTKIVIKPPVIDRLPKKSVIKNFGQICAQLNRDQQHVMNYFLSELSADGSIAGGDNNEKETELTIKNRLQPKNVQSLFKKYIVEFVQCQLCKSQNTELVKDKQTRLDFLQCQNCKSTRSVAPIKKKT